MRYSHNPCMHVSSSHPLGKFSRPVSEPLLPPSLEVLVLEWVVLLLGATKIILLKWELRFLPGHFGHLMPLSQQTKKGITVLESVIEPDSQGEIGLLLYNGGKKY